MGLFSTIGDVLDDVKDAFVGAGKATFAAAGAGAYVSLAGGIKLANRDIDERRLSELGLDADTLAHFRRSFAAVADHVRFKFGAQLVESIEILGQEIGANPDGQTFGMDIYIQHPLRSADDDQQLHLLAHEMTHSMQYDTRGRSLFEFGYDYFSEFWDAGFEYDKNDMEEEADRVADCFVTRVRSEIQPNRLGDVRQWRTGWSVFAPFYINNNPHYLAYRRDERRVHLTRVLDDRATTNVLLDTVLPSPVWTTFVPLVIANQPHFLAYNESTGQVRMLRVVTTTPDAPTLEALWSDDWKSSWMFMPFMLNGVQHYLAYRTETGRVHLTRLGPDGRGQRTYEDDWSEGWTNFYPFQISGHPHFLAYKRGSGTVHLSRIDAGATGTSTLQKGDWTGTWTNFVPLGANGRRFVMYKGPFRVGSDTMNGTGSIQVRDIEDSGTRTEEKWCDDWRGSISTLFGYTLNGRPYLLRYEADNGEARFYEFNNV